MMGGTLGSRLARVETTAQARIQQLTRGPTMLVVFLDTLSAEDLVAFEGEHPGARDDVVERRTGQRPGPGTRLIVITTRADGPERGESGRESGRSRRCCAHHGDA
jgi:hypothetical protein